MFLVYNMARPGVRAPLKQWKWLAVVSPLAAPVTLDSELWHGYKHSSCEPKYHGASSNCITYRDLVIYPNYSVQTCACGTWRDINFSFHSPLFAWFQRSRLLLSAHPELAADADNLLSISTKPREFRKMVGKWSQAKSNRSSSYFTQWCSSEYVFSMEKIRTGEKGKVESETG